MEKEKEIQLSFYQKVQKVQEELRRPKNQYNKFGGYYYRNCEDICNAVKPLLAKYGLILTLTDSIELIGERYYVKATAGLHDLDSSQGLFNVAFAREEEVKKGMDGSQITGASSSYARKYALNGLFLIDDVKDSDSTNTETKMEFKNEEMKDGKYRSYLDEFFYSNPDRLPAFLNAYRINKTDELDSVLTLKQIDAIITKLKKELNNNGNV